MSRLPRPSIWWLLAALAVVSKEGVQWARVALHPGPALAFVGGVLPNLQGTVALTFLGLGLRFPIARRRGEGAAAVADQDRWFVRVVAIAAGAMVVWELAQRLDPEQVFDLWDIAASVAGAAAAALLYALVRVVSAAG